MTGQTGVTKTWEVRRLQGRWIVEDVTRELHQGQAPPWGSQQQAGYTEAILSLIEHAWP